MNLIRPLFNKKNAQEQLRKMNRKYDDFIRKMEGEDEDCFLHAAQNFDKLTKKLLVDSQQTLLQAAFKCLLQSKQAFLREAKISKHKFPELRWATFVLGVECDDDRHREVAETIRHCMKLLKLYMKALHHVHARIRTGLVEHAEKGAVIGTRAEEARRSLIGLYSDKKRNLIALRIFEKVDPPTADIRTIRTRSALLHRYETIDAQTQWQGRLRTFFLRLLMLIVIALFIGTILTAVDIFMEEVRDRPLNLEDPGLLFQQVLALGQDALHALTALKVLGKLLKIYDMLWAAVPVCLPLLLERGSLRSFFRQGPKGLRGIEGPRSTKPGELCYWSQKKDLKSFLGKERHKILTRSVAQFKPGELVCFADPDDARPILEIMCTEFRTNDNVFSFTDYDDLFSYETAFNELSSLMTPSEDDLHKRLGHFCFEA